MAELKTPSFLDIVTFNRDIKVIESFTYPVGAVCLLQKGETTSVFNIDSFYGCLNTTYSSFQKPDDTILIYSRLFLERLRNGNTQPINFDALPNIITGTTPDFVQVRNGFELNKTSQKVA